MPFCITVHFSLWSLHGCVQGSVWPVKLWTIPVIPCQSGWVATTYSSDTQQMLQLESPLCDTDYRNFLHKTWSLPHKLVLFTKQLLHCYTVLTKQDGGVIFCLSMHDLCCFIIDWVCAVFQLAHVCWWFYFSKLIELLDTVSTYCYSCIWVTYLVFNYLKMDDTGLSGQWNY